jgi:uncharacterized membrane protein YgcG
MQEGKENSEIKNRKGDIAATKDVAPVSAAIPTVTALLGPPTQVKPVHPYEPMLLWFTSDKLRSYPSVHAWALAATWSTTRNRQEACYLAMMLDFQRSERGGAYADLADLMSSEMTVRRLMGLIMLDNPRSKNGLANMEQILAPVLGSDAGAPAAVLREMEKFNRLLGGWGAGGSGGSGGGGGKGKKKKGGGGGQGDGDEGDDL